MLDVTKGKLYISFGEISSGILMLNDQPTTKITMQDNGMLVLMGRSIFMSKLERRRLIHFASFNGTDWEALGVDIDDMSKELNPDTETGKNVLGETTFKHNGYEPELSVEPYYADTTSTLYDGLRDAAVWEKSDDDSIKGYFCEAVFEDDPVNGVFTSTLAVKRDAYIVPQSTGGDTSGFQIPFTVTPTGAPVEVTVTYTVATRAVTVTAKSNG